MNPNLDASKYIELNLRESGREKCIPDKIFTFTPKNYHLFHYIISGKGAYTYNGVTTTLKAGQIFYIAPGEKPVYGPDKFEPWSYIWVGFSGSNADELLRLSGISQKNPFYSDKERELKFLFDSIAQNKNHDGTFNLISLGYLYEVLAIMIRNNKDIVLDEKISAKLNHINSAKEFILNNYQFEITVEDIAKSVGVSPNYLANIFAEYEKCSPKKYLTKIRMEHAALLLGMNKYKIKEVAKMVSYSNQLHFAASFKLYYGISASEYMKQYKKEGK